MHHSTSQPHVTAQCIPHHYTAIVHITTPQVFSILHNYTTFHTTPHCTTTSRHTRFHRRTSTLCTTLTIPDHTSTFHSKPHLKSQNYTSHTLHLIPHHHILQITASSTFHITQFCTTPPHPTSHITNVTHYTTFYIAHHHIAPSHIAHQSCILHHTDAFHTTPSHGNNIHRTTTSHHTAFHTAPHLTSHHIPHHAPFLSHQHFPHFTLSHITPP